MFNKYEHDLKRAKQIWEEFVNGGEPDLSCLPENIQQSWRRSRGRGIDHKGIVPYAILEREKLDGNKAYNFIEINYDLLESFVRVATINEIKLNIYDIGTSSMFSILGEDYTYLELSEDAIGTNAIPLAIAENKPATVLKYQHTLEALNNNHCIAAPLRDERGCPLGAVFAMMEDDELLAIAYSLIVCVAHVLNGCRNYKEQESKYREFRGVNGSAFANKRSSLVASYTFENIIGEMHEMVNLREMAKLYANSNIPILIHGESGSGKEVLAQAIHNASNRKRGPFVAINCGAIPQNLVESELFGYEPGAFTGALKSGKKGQLELASTGTVFLDEIESMPMYVQVKLLRVLSTNKIMKVGGDKETPINIRVISASKKNLLDEADHERFREDLYYRISTARLTIPPLRQRLADLPLLVDYILANLSNPTHSAIHYDESFLEPLSCYFWRGNIRELENVMRIAVITLGDYSKKLSFENLPETIQKAYNFNKAKDTLEEFHNTYAEDRDAAGMLRLSEEIVIRKVLEDNNFQIEKSAQILGINRKSLYNKIQRNPRLLKNKKEK